MRSGSTGGGEAEESGGGEQDHGGKDADQEQALSFVDHLMSCFNIIRVVTLVWKPTSGLFFVFIFILPVFVKKMNR